MSGEAAALPAGISVGHWTDPAGQTGCTVVLAAGGAVGGVDVRGAAPGTRETDALRPGTLVDRVHAVLLTGGSAFGLAAATGVMDYLEERGTGFQVGPLRVPIVAAAVLFDLLIGDSAARPDAAAGYAACQSATTEPLAGPVGAGTGATVAKAGGAPPQPGGLGIASARAGKATVAAIVAANGVGGIWDDERHEWIAELAGPPAAAGVPGANTTVGVVATDAQLSKEQASRVATVAHDGIARAVRPAHTSYDGDTMFCLATGLVPAADVPPGLLETTAAVVVARAIAGGVRAAREVGVGRPVRRGR